MAFDGKILGIIAIALTACNASESEVEFRAVGGPFHDGVATASELLVAETAAKVMSDGGNAIDAAVAAMAVMNVVEPQSSGVGGGGFVMIHLAETGETHALNCREMAGAATRPDVFVNQPDALRTSSGTAVGVPGMVACAATMLDNWGTISLAKALEPAIEAAEKGITVSKRLASDALLPKLGNEVGNPVYDTARAVFRPGGVAIQEGTTLFQPELAHTFELLAEFGPDAFYQCEHPAGIARAIVNTQRATRTGNPDGEGRMKCSDLAAYEVQVLEPVSQSYRGYEILSMPPPSSGGIAVLQILAMLERFPIGDELAGFGFGDFLTLNVMLEAMRLAFADRAYWVGDDDCPKVKTKWAGCTDVPVAGLLADSYLADRSMLIHPGQPKNMNITAGNPAPNQPIFAAEVAADDGGNDTSHVSIIDRAGNVVSLTMSIEETWGTGIMVPGYGFLLNNELTDFNRVPTFNPDPLLFNPGANDAAPFKQPRSSMAPTIVLSEGEVVAAYGSPGGAAIINAVVGFTLNLFDHQLGLEQSVKAPRISIGNASAAARADVEVGLDVGALGALGYLFNAPINIPPGIGAVQAVVQDPVSGDQFGAADDRRFGAVVAADN